MSVSYLDFQKHVFDEGRRVKLMLIATKPPMENVEIRRHLVSKWGIAPKRFPTLEFSRIREEGSRGHKQKQSRGFMTFHFDSIYTSQKDRIMVILVTDRY